MYNNKSGSLCLLQSGTYPLLFAGNLPKWHFLCDVQVTSYTLQCKPPYYLSFAQASVYLSYATTITIQTTLPSHWTTLPEFCPSLGILVLVGVSSKHVPPPLVNQVAKWHERDFVEGHVKQEVEIAL